MVPAADRVGHARGRGESHPPQGRQGFRIVLDPCEDEGAIGGGQGLLALEQFAVGAVDADQQGLDPAVEGGEVALTRQRRHRRPGRGLDRQGVGLFVVEHLHPVLQPAQFDIGGGQGGAGFGADMAALEDLSPDNRSEAKY